MITLGLDCGTSALKAVLIDEHQHALAASACAYAPDHPQPLWSEQNPQVWLDAMIGAIAQIRQAAPTKLAALGAIGFSGQMHSAVLLGADDAPLRPALLHNDGRAFAQARALHEAHPELAAIVGVKPMAGFTAPKLMWLREHEPQTYALLRKVLLPKDYLRLYFTGQIATDMSDAAGTWWLDEARRQWSPEALDASGAAPGLLPPLLEGAGIAGRVRDKVADALGLPRGVLVAAGGGDAATGAVGIGAIGAGDATISLGTSMQFILADDRYRADPGRLVHSFAHALPQRWYRMGAMLTGASALAFAARLTGSTPDELDHLAAQDYRGPGELTFLPYLTGERTPHDDPAARGVFFGLSPSTGRAEIARAVMEGVACALVDARDCVVGDGPAPAQIGLTGGGARSALWTRMIASALETPILRYKNSQSGPAFGAARLARLAVGAETAQDVCTAPEVADIAAPEPALAQAFAKRVEQYRRLYAALKPEFAAAAAP